MPDSGGNDLAQKALDDACAFAQAGEFAKALERHEWFHANALTVARGYYGVRLSFALSAWRALGDEYPPALESLRRTRDTAVAVFAGGAGDFRLFHDFCSINEELEEQSLTLELFRRLHVEQPQLARECFTLVRSLLSVAGEAELFMQYTGDLLVYLQEAVARHQENIARLKADDSLESTPEELEEVLNSFDVPLIELSLELIAFAEGQGDSVTAKKLFDTVLPLVVGVRSRLV